MSISQASCRSWVPALAAAVAWLGVAGCGSGIPKTYPVKGRVVWEGGKPVTDGRIEFQSLSDPSLRATGEIDDDGNFSLTTYRDGRERAGAVAGEHKVIVEPEWGDEKLIIPLPNSYTVERKDNAFTIELRPPKRR